MNKELAVSIVRVIIRDIHRRFGLEQAFEEIGPRIQVKIYDEWIRIVSVELEKAGVIDKVYEPLNVDEMSFVDVINRSAYYLKSDDE